MSKPALGLSLVLAVGCHQPRAPAPAVLEGFPNVVIVSLDTLRADHLALHGYERDPVPTLGRLAAEGAHFTQVWSASSNTDGTHGSLMSGKAVSTHGKLGHKERLAESHLTFAEHFAQHGYRTFGVASSDKFVPDSGFAQGFEVWERFTDGAKNTWSTRTNARALELMAADDGRPFLGFVHLFDPHAPYNAPEPHKGAFLRGPLDLEPRRTVDFIRDHRADPAVPEELRHDLVDLYDGCLSYLDTRLAALSRAVRATERPTMLVLTSDHGEAFGEHDFYGHSKQVWEETVRVPWVIWAPGRVASGTRVETPAHSFDLYPTVAELAGLPIPPELEGLSFAGELQGGETTVPTDRTLPVQAGANWALVKQTSEGLFKLRVHLKPRGLRLYELGSDPGETTDVKDAHPEVVAAFVEVLGELGVSNPGRNAELREDVDAAELEALRAIGYVE